jgi:hypothetical protein
MEMDVLRLVIFSALGVLLFSKHRVIAKVIEAFNKNFPRGGPPTPMHPSPAGDDALLRRRSSKRGKKEWFY